MEMSLNDILVIVAILLGPVLAVQIEKKLERIKQKKERKLHIFKKLMATRAAILSPGHVEALNLIDVEFNEDNDKEKTVLRAWKAYFDHLHPNVKESMGDVKIWNDKANDYLADLLYEMSICLGYDFDKTHIKRSAYSPQGHINIQNAQTNVLGGLLDILNGKKPLPIEIKGSSEES